MEFMLQILMSAEGFYSAQRCSCFYLWLFAKKEEGNAGHVLRQGGKNEFDEDKVYQ